jgi:hypothetical protein
MLGEPDAVIEGLAVALLDADPVDVFDGVPERLDDPLAEDDFVEERVASPDGRAELVRDTLGDPDALWLAETVFVSVELLVVVLLIEDVRVADALPDGVRVLVTEPVDNDDAEGERLFVGLRVAVAVPLAVLVPLDELVADFDAEDVREDDGEAVAVVDAVDVREAEGEPVAVREALGLRVPDTDPVELCVPELDFVPDAEPVAVRETVDVRVDVIVCRGERVPVDVRVDVIVCRGERVPVDVRVDVTVGSAVLVLVADLVALRDALGLRVPVTELLDVREPELDFDVDGEAVPVRETDDDFVAVREESDVGVGFVPKFSKDRLYGSKEDLNEGLSDITSKKLRATKHTLKNRYIRPLLSVSILLGAFVKHPIVFLSCHVSAFK